jgi:hypothetical protein
MIPLIQTESNVYMEEVVLRRRFTGGGFKNKCSLTIVQTSLLTIWDYHSGAAADGMGYYAESKNIVHSFSGSNILEYLT